MASSHREPGVARRWLRLPPWLVADLVWALAIGLLGLGLRIACAREFVAHPLGQAPWIDEQAYWERALTILGGGWLPQRPFYQDPLYPYLLAALMAIVGTELATVRLSLACLGALTPVWVFWAGRIGLGRAEGVVAGLAVALYGPLIFTDATLEKEGIGATAAALAIGLTAWSWGQRRAWPALVAGWAWGLVTLLRANALIVAPLGAIWWLVCSRGRPGGRGMVRAAAFLGGFALVIAPVTLINAMVSSPPEFLLTTWQAGANFYIGNGPEASGTYAEIPNVRSHPFFEADDFAAEARRRAGRPLTLGQTSRYWFRAGLDRWTSAPAASLRLVARKIALLANDYEVADNQNHAFVRVVAVPALGWGIVSFGWLTPWAVAGLRRPDRSPFWWFLVLTTVAGLGSTVAFFVVGRYRLPWVPGLALLGAAGAVDLARRFRSRDWRGFALSVVLMAPVAVLAWTPTAIPVEDRWGLGLRRLALASMRTDQLDRAIDALDDARALGSRPTAHLATMLAVGPEHDLVARHVDEVRRSGLGQELRLARLLRQIPEGRAEARRLLDAALRDVPSDPRARAELGAWWLGELQHADPRRRAAEELARAARGPDGDASAAILLALLTSDPSPLNRPADDNLARRSARWRIAWAILDDRN
ncbi:4-amino-4-deoxy-L-arabinose transferase [Singulisphaera sp. GP187]|uniref:glycosyltransferase family 39 protein n=1 Tax=Singulisphaera sp. GP187 TaxID=1882752 RepID=UPI000926C69D|nr:glycosyltransferase family 39 protein [Singulisphaera sp. GP187]SIO36778.1 4-amino-4-deoxy-L-arabinose transferase [Singulisphaera sp. GP187]